MDFRTDVVIVGTGVAGTFSALNLPKDKNIIMITKSDLESSDSFLAQGGICVLTDENDYDNYFEDTMKAGHYENRKESVDIMIRSSQEIIHDLIGYGVDFAHDGDKLLYTREGAHSRPRILFHEDITGQEITSKLLAQVKKLPNVTIYEYTTMTDIIVQDGHCAGIIAKTKDGGIMHIRAEDTIFASGGIGGCYKHSTNFPHLTGYALDITKKHGIRLEHLDYVQIHPTTLYSKDAVEESFAEGKVVFFAGGTGHPYFSTDTATVLRAVEIGADAILLAKAVDGIYDSDPKVNPDAKKYDEISIDEVVAKKLAAMDLTASIMCMEQKMPMLVFGLDEKDSIVNTVHGKFSGTKVTV